MKPRITVNTTEGGTFEIWLNPEGRDLLVRGLQALTETNEHFHLSPFEVELRSHPYRPSDTIFEYGTIYYRTDEWDRLYYPHVVDQDEK